jgi:hypothetical protein
VLRNWCVRAEAQPGVWCAWRGPALLVLDDNGIAKADTVAGFFFRETRYLSNFALRINGESPFRCSAAQINANRLEFTYIYPPSTWAQAAAADPAARAAGAAFFAVALMSGSPATSTPAGLISPQN